MNEFINPLANLILILNLDYQMLGIVLELLRRIPFEAKYRSTYLLKKNQRSVRLEITRNIYLKHIR